MRHILVIDFDQGFQRPAIGLKRSIDAASRYGRIKPIEKAVVNLKRDGGDQRGVAAYCRRQSIVREPPGTRVD